MGSLSDNKKMESGKDGLRTIECLRGRLLSERNASKVAKEEAELMGNKLIELENKVKEETKLKRKAEKKLKLLTEKLQSLKISHTLEGSEVRSSSSENIGFSSTSSTTSISSPKDTEESNNDQSKSLSIEANQSNSGHPLEVSSSTQDSSCDSCSIRKEDSPLGKSCCGSNLTSQHSDSYYLRSEASMVKMDNIEAFSDNDHEDNGDAELALVPVLPTASTNSIKSMEFQTIDNSVSEVLDALRLIRQKIQSSIEKRHVIRVGPA